MYYKYFYSSTQYWSLISKGVNISFRSLHPSLIFAGEDNGGVDNIQSYYFKPLDT
jgi:hypothetical protein